MNTKFLDALTHKNKRRPPIWLMRQAGRYMPEYQRLRSKMSLFDMFHDPEMIVKVTKLPIELLHVDAAILFADILSVLDGLGVAWHFQEGKGPIIPNRVTPLTKFVKKTDYSHTKEAIIALKRELKVPLIGFCGAPFTVASYLIEGGTSKDLKHTKAWAYHDPHSFHRLLNDVAEATIEYIEVQIESGVDAIQIFDSWASQMSLQQFQEFCLPCIEKIMKKIRVPVILFSKGSSNFIEGLAALKPQAISCDWTEEIGSLRKKIPSPIALQGNLDPCILLTDHKTIEREASKLINSMQGDPSYIFNLGHGILPETPFENVKFLVDYVASR